MDERCFSEFRWGNLLLTGLGNREPFCLEGGWRVTLLLNHITWKKKLKKVRFHRKTTSQSGKSECIWWQPMLLDAAQKTSWCSHSRWLFPSILTFRLCFLASFFFFFLTKKTVDSEKIPAFVLAKKWQPGEVAWSHARMKSVRLWSSCTTPSALTAFVTSNAKQLKTPSRWYYPSCCRGLL